MARPVWKGHISFGLVNIPVALYSGEERTDIQFHLIDTRNAARVRYERVNEETGEEVPWDRIVKGYEYADDNYVLLSELELESASVEMTRQIEIEQFVELQAIDLRHFERPYWLVPENSGEKGYVLLREALSQTQMAGIAKVVIRTRQHLAAVLVREHALILELLRFEQELKSASDFEIPHKSLKQARISGQELSLAIDLIQGMSRPWRPSAFRDDYRQALLKLVRRKVKSGKTHEIAQEEAVPVGPAPTINLMEVLKKSLTGKSSRGMSRPSKRQRRAPAARKRPSRRRAS